MGSVVSGVTDAVGLTNHAGEKAASAAASRAADRSYSLTKEELAFQKEQYNDWKNIYGDLQEELGTYYKNLTGSDVSASEVQEIQAATQASQLQIDTELAQRGLSGSGLEASLTSQNIFAGEQAKATARASADDEVALQQAGFLSLGLGTGTDILSNTAGVSSSGASSQSSIAGSYNDLSGSLGTANIKSMGSLYGTAAGAAIAKSDRRLKKNIQFVEEVKGIKFYTWEWNEIGESLGHKGTSFGVIAQEVEKVIPNSTIEQNGYLAVNYQAVMAYLKDK